MIFKSDFIRIFEFIDELISLKPEEGVFGKRKNCIKQGMFKNNSERQSRCDKYFAKTEWEHDK